MPGSRRIVLASRNPGKVREIRAVLAGAGIEAVGLDEIDPRRAIPEPAEHGASFAENARAKAAYYARATRAWALADDSGLEVAALGGAPGVRSARYAADRCPTDAARDQIDAANNAKLLRELEGIGDERRGARFVCHLALSDGRNILLEATGVVEGRIAHRPAGRNGFGYDPLFFVGELGCTTAQLPPERKNEISHRGRAVREFARLLAELPDRP
jgi:XTP/dITP diphosphohydrolase